MSDRESLLSHIGRFQSQAVRMPIPALEGNLLRKNCRGHGAVWSFPWSSHRGTPTSIVPSRMTISATWSFVSLGLSMTASTSYGSVDVKGVAEVRPAIGWVWSVFVVVRSLISKLVLKISPCISGGIEVLEGNLRIYWPTSSSGSVAGMRAEIRIVIVDVLHIEQTLGTMASSERWW